MFRNILKKYSIHPRRWLLGLVSYSRFIGYIRPQLLSGNASNYNIWRRLYVTSWEPRELAVPVGKRILVISPHSDDEAIGAGGLLWAHRDAAEIHIVLVTDGAGFGHVPQTGQTVEQATEELINLRKHELQKTAAALNAKSIVYLDLPDGRVEIDESSVAKLRTVFDTVMPDIVIIPWFLDNHRDHRAVNKLFAQACTCPNALVLGYEIWQLLDPNAYFDITEHLDVKLSLIENYKSQIQQVDYTTFARGLAQVRGYQFIKGPGQKAAEAFVALPAVDYCDIVNEVL